MRRNTKRRRWKEIQSPCESGESFNMCDMTHSHVWHDSSVLLLLLSLRHDSFIRDSLICETWFIHMWDMTHSYARHDWFICETYLIHMCNMTHAYARHVLFMRERERERESARERARERERGREREGARGREREGERERERCETLLIRIRNMTHLYVRHDSFICETWLIHMWDMTRLTCDCRKPRIPRSKCSRRKSTGSLQHTATHCNTLQPQKNTNTKIEMFKKKIDWVLEDLLPGRWRPPCTMVTATHRNTPQHTATHRNTPQFAALQHTAWPLAPSLHNDLCCSAVLQCVAVLCCSAVLQCCVAVLCCSVLQWSLDSSLHNGLCCSTVMQCVALCCSGADSIWRSAGARGNTLQHTATHCNTLQHIATHCNTLQQAQQHTLPQVTFTWIPYDEALACAATHCNTLQYTATHSSQNSHWDMVKCLDPGFC